jgi:predicted nucleic acid-binding protein
VIDVLIESDLLIPIFKREDRLRAASEKVLREIASGRLAGAYASTAAMQEIIFWLYNKGLLGEAVNGVKALNLIPNLDWVPVDGGICLQATLLMKEYGVSPFDAYHAATALSRDSTIMSTEHVYERIQGLTVLDPRVF